MPDIHGTSLMVTAALGEAGPQFNIRAAALSEELAALKRKLATLFGHLAGSAAWDGMSFAEYSVRQAEWDAAANEMFCELLPQIAHILNVNYDNYCQGENTCTRSWQM